MLISQKLEAMTADYKDARAVVGSFMLDADVLARAAALLARSERIAMLCISPNSILAELFQRKMMQIGVQIELIQQSEQSFHTLSLGNRDRAIVISYSGNNASRASMRYLSRLEGTRRLHCRHYQRRRQSSAQPGGLCTDHVQP